MAEPYTGPIDEKNLEMSGLSEEQYRLFLGELEALNAAYTDASDPDLIGQDSNFQFAGTNLNVDGLLTDDSPLTSQQERDAQYRADFNALAESFGIPTVVQGTDKVYYLDPGVPLDPYGESRPNDPFGTRAGMYTRDARTEGDTQWGNVATTGLAAVTGALLGAGVAGGLTGGAAGGAAGTAAPAAGAATVGGAAIPGTIQGGAAAGGLLGGTGAATGAAVGGLLGDDDNTGPGDIGTPFQQPDYGEGTWHPDPGPTDPTGAAPPPWLQTVIDIALGRGNVAGIPIPGLPFPIPGNTDILTPQAVWEWMQRTGANVWEAIEGILSGGSEEPTPPGSGNEGTPGEEEEPPSPPLIPGPGDGGGGGNGGVPPQPEPPQPEPPPTEPPPLVPPEPGPDDPPPIAGDPNQDPSPPPLTPTPGDGTDFGPLPPIGPSPLPPIPEDPEHPQQPPVGPGTPQDPQDPGYTDTDRRDASGALLGLIPFLFPEQDNGGSEYGLWDYIGPDTSYGWQRPDYGQPDMRGPLNMPPPQPSQPIQVDTAPGPAPRRPFMTPVEWEREQRRQRGLL